MMINISLEQKRDTRNRKEKDCSRKIIELFLITKKMIMYALFPCYVASTDESQAIFGAANLIQLKLWSTFWK